MGSQISFWTPVQYESQHISFVESCGEWADELFRWSRDIALVRSNQGNVKRVTLEERDLSGWNITFKVAAYMTVVLPILAFLVKLLHRCSASFYNNNQNLEERSPALFDAEGSTQWREFSSRTEERGNLFIQVLEPDQLPNGQKWKFHCPSQPPVEGQNRRIEMIILLPENRIQLTWRPPQAANLQGIPIQNSSRGAVILSSNQGEETRLAAGGYSYQSPPEEIRQA